MFNGNIVSILNSFEIIFSKLLYSLEILENTQNVFSRCDEMMDKNTTFGCNSIDISSKDMLLIQT